MDICLLIKTVVTDLDNIDTSIRTFKSREHAINYLIMEKDCLMNQIIQMYDEDNFDNFELYLYGEINSTEDTLEFLDREGKLQIKYELKTITI